MIKDILHFVNHDLWTIDDESLSKPKLFLLQKLRAFILAGKGFVADEVMIRASALTFYTLISIVPVIAMAFGIAKGFGFEEMLNKQIYASFENQPQVSEMLIEFSKSFIENTKGGLIAGFGMLVLFWSVMQVFTNIELSFNAIWHIKIPRNWVRKITEYLSFMLVVPILIIVSGSLTIYLSSAAHSILSSDSILFTIGPFFEFALRSMPYMIIWLLFTFIYIALPNTRVSFKSALFAGIIAGTAFQLLEWAYFSFQIGAVKYNAIYGSFAAFPLFLVWLQSSWLIVLFGCEVAYADQNASQFLYDTEVKNISVKHKKKVTLLIFLLIYKNFKNCGKPFTVNYISESLKIPVQLVQNIITQLKQSGLVLEIKSENAKLVGYTPAKDYNAFTTADFVHEFELFGCNDLPIKKSKEWLWAEKTINDFTDNNQKSLSNTSFEMVLSDFE